MARKIIPLLVLLAAMAATVAAATPWPDVTRPPTPADREAIMAKGWDNSRDAIGAALTRAYVPGSASHPGSLAQPAEKSWLLLWQYCELLERDEEAETVKFIALHSNIAPGPQSQPGVQGATAKQAHYSAVEAAIKKTLADPRHRAALLTRQLLPDSPDPQKRPLADILQPKIQTEWLADEDFLRLLFDNLSPRDYSPAVLRNLQAMRLAQPDKFREYRALAIAIAVVYDEKFPVNWPHYQVDRKLVPIKEYPPADWFAFWVNSNEPVGHLLLDLRKLPPEQIKFIVDAPLDESEYAWARKNIPHGREDFAKTFSDIAYAHNRYDKNIMNWDGPAYTLAAIKTRGGICVDQAYFASIAGKARGLPTLYFSGVGNDARHAWFGYLKGKDLWELDCGRYLNQHFVTGFTTDPQTWTRISDHQLAFLTEHFHSRPEYAASQDDLVMAGIFEAQEDLGRAAKALDSAIAGCPKNPDAWDAKTDFLERTNAPLADLRAHHEAAIKQFASVPDLKAEHQNALAAIMETQGDHAKASIIEHRVVSQNQDARSDLSVDVAAKQVTSLITSGDLTAAYQEYKKQMSAIGLKSGGNFFYQITQPMVAAFLKAGDPGRAKQALDLARQTLRPPSDSMLERSMNTLEKTVTAKPSDKNTPPSRS